MTSYIIYNIQGEILRTGSCPDDMFELQKNGDEYIIAGQANDLTQKIVGGKVVDK